jgi:two-component system, cell cycle sensor histidine kinase and response regulator CckA
MLRSVFACPTCPALTATLPAMHLDLPTLLLIRLCIDGFLVALFASYARRHPGVRGPRWWAGAAVASALCTLGMFTGLGGRADWNVFNVGGSVALITLSQALLWLGLRSHLGLPLRAAVRWTAVGILVMFVVQGLLLEVWDMHALRRAAFVAVSMGLVALCYVDVRRDEAQRGAEAFKAFKLLCIAELLVMGLILLRLLYVAAVPSVDALTQSSSYVVLFVTLDAMVRAAILSGLVSHRLQQEGEADRQKLEDGKSNLRALIDNIHAGVVVMNADRSIDTINAAALDFLKHAAPLAEVEGQAPTQAFRWTLLREDGSLLAREDLPCDRVMATGQPVTDVVLGVRAPDTGQARWALCNAFAENDSQGGLRRVVMTFLEITALQAAQREQKALQAQLSQSQKMEALGTLAGGVAHDFNNILAAILGNAELARQDLPADAPAVQSLQEISTAARRGRDLVRQILAYSRQQPMERKRVSMRAVLAECCALLKPTMPPQIKLGTACGPGDLSINADATQLGQVLLNLGTNAVHALAGQSGQLTMQLNRFPVTSSLLPPSVPSTWQGVVRLQVIDNGCGMDEATRLRIFEPFFTTRKLGTGTGLGLPMVLGIVEGHGGVIEVHSRLGEGTTFNLYFPAAVDDPGEDHVDSGWPQGPAVPLDDDSNFLALKRLPDATSVQNETMTTENPTSKKSHVLYLDDDDTLVFLVRRLLERRGYKVTTFTDQDAAIDAVRGQPGAFDLLMTDFNMPGKSGLDVARAVLAIDPNLPVAVASGYITDELQAEAMAAGVREVVFKTDAVEDFCNLVAKLVEGKVD